MVISPLTNESQVSLLDEIPTSRLIADWNNAFSFDITEEFKGCEKILLYRCDKTGLKFFMPLTVAGSANLYAQLKKFDWYYMPWKWENAIAMNSLKGGDRILEVGCGVGAFVEKVHAKGFAIKGIELNPDAVETAQRKKLPVSETNLLDLANSEVEAFDVVCSFQVLEHLPDPKNFINSSLKILKKTGILIFSVPNSESFLKYQYNLLDMPPHHMTQWSEVSFRALERFFPVKLDKVFYEPLAAYHVSGYLNAYSQHYKAELKWLNLFFNRHTLPIFVTILKLGLKRFFRGQSIFVQFRKL
jgi:SAM-dependent methyltransferase